MDMRARTDLPTHYLSPLNPPARARPTPPAQRSHRAPLHPRTRPEMPPAIVQALAAGEGVVRAKGWVFGARAYSCTLGLGYLLARPGVQGGLGFNAFIHRKARHTSACICTLTHKRTHAHTHTHTRTHTHTHTRIHHVHTYSVPARKTEATEREIRCVHVCVCEGV